MILDKIKHGDEGNSYIKNAIGIHNSGFGHVMLGKITTDVI